MLPELFPKAKYIVTYRQPLSWLNSRLNYHEGKQPEEWKPYREHIWSRHFNGYDKEETYLKEQGLYSLSAYLKQYAEQYLLLLQHLPPQQTLLIKTEDINKSADKIENFCLGPNNTKKVKAVETNKFKPRGNILDNLDQAYVVRMIDKEIESLELLDKLQKRFDKN